MTVTACGNDHVHNFATAYSHDANNHWYACEGCEEKKDIAAHVWNDGEVTKAATFAEEGVLTKTCKCGATMTEKIDNLTKSAIVMSTPSIEEMGEEMTNEEYLEIIQIYRNQATEYISMTTGKTHYFSFEKQNSSMASLVYYSVTVMRKGETWDDTIENTASINLYSANDFKNPILVQEHTVPSFYYDATNPLPNGKYYLAITIDSLVDEETTLNEIKIYANYCD